MISLQRLILVSLLVLFFVQPSVAQSEKVDICHYPPGSSNAEIISVSLSAASTHLQKHEDALYWEGQCLSELCTTCAMTNLNMVEACAESNEILSAKNQLQDIAESLFCEELPRDGPQNEAVYEECVAVAITSSEQRAADKDAVIAECENAVLNYQPICAAQNANMYATVTELSCTPQRAASYLACQENSNDVELAAREVLDDCFSKQGCGDDLTCLRSCLSPYGQSIADLTPLASACFDAVEPEYQLCLMTSQCPIIP